jgi:hypothetical protein
MPSSVKDRLTNAHEHVFLLTKKAKYFYDADAISEDAKYAEQHAKKATSWGHKKSRTNKNNIEKYQAIGIENNRTCLPAVSVISATLGPFLPDLGNGNSVTDVTLFTKARTDVRLLRMAEPRHARIVARLTNGWSTLQCFLPI